MLKQLCFPGIEGLEVVLDGEGLWLRLHSVCVIDVALEDTKRVAG